MILLIDNYDSFTYNLKQCFMELNQRVEVVRNDKIDIGGISSLSPSHIVLSPGPGRPEDAGICPEVIKEFSGKIPLLGVCLGHQAIGQVFGGDIVSAKKLMHGKVSHIDHQDTGVFNGLPRGFEATRYHSLVIDRENVPDDLEITAFSEDGEIMGVRHRTHLTEGVQFHPESILTGEGKNILRNFLDYFYEKKADGIIIREAIGNVIEKKNLDAGLAKAVMNEIMEGKASDAQIASLLTGLRSKGETVDEITAFAKVMREKSVTVKPEAENLVDTCGTGGDSSGTFNISTAAAIVAAGAGIPVAKHGNRSVSSRSGSADVLEALNVNIMLEPDQVAQCIDEVGIGFLFAPKLHPAMKHAIGPRREMGIRTVFNVLGPLTNPAGARYQVMGVFETALVETIARVLAGLGIVRGFVVSSYDGMDEAAISGKTKVAKVDNGDVKVYDFSPGEAGFNEDKTCTVPGGSAEENAEIIRAILEGEKGPARDIVCLNAGFAAAAALDITVKEGVKEASLAIDSGRAKKVLSRLVEFSRSV